MKDYATAWEGCLRTIRRNVNEQSFKTWFEPIKPIKLTGSVLTIQVPNKFFYEWLEEHYVPLLKMTIRQELGEKGRLEYQIVTPKKTTDIPIQPMTSPPQNAMNTNTVKPGAKGDAPNMIDSDAIKNPFIIPGIRRIKVDPQLHESLTFENFIEGDCNRLARSAGLAVSQNPGKTAFNPLFFFGDTGLGKTHLAQSIGNEIIRRDVNKNVLYVSCEKFAQQVVQAIKGNAVNDLVNFYHMIDVLIVDDIQFLKGKNKTQEIFFHIFNQLHQAQKQIILTSDRAPKDLDGMEDRLISRFKWGLSADLQTPDLETRMAILESKMSQEGVDLPNTVVEFIAYNVQSNIRELEGVLVSLIAQSSLNRRGIDMELARSVIKSFVLQMNKEITVDFIKELVAEHFNVSPDKLKGQTRKRSIVVARQISMYLAKNLTSASLKTIGEEFGGRDHSTVIYSLRAVRDLLDTDAIFKDTVAELEKKIKTNLTTT